MLKSIKFLSEKSRGRVGKCSTFVCSVILRRYSLQEVPWRRIHNVIAHAMSVCVDYGNKVMDTRLPQPAGCGDKYDVSGLGSRLLRCALNDGASNGEGLHRPWCNKILGTRPRMTGGRGAGFARLLYRYTSRNDGASNGEELHRPWCNKILGTDCASRPRMTGGRGANSFGRSMIEMLGVLAIIGVLSVGGIAGYSKAMEKWKAERLVSEYSNLILGLLANVGEFQNMSKTAEYDTQIGLAQYVQAASLVPQTWKYIRDSRMYDSEGNPILMFSRRNRLVIDIYIGTELNEGNNISGKSKGFSVTLCREIMQNLTKPLSSSLQFSRFYQWSKMEDSSVYWGDAGCSAGRKCLRDLTVSEINDICKSCDKDSEACGINLEF